MYSHKDITGTAGYVAIATIIARPQYSMNALVKVTLQIVLYMCQAHEHYAFSFQILL